MFTAFCEQVQDIHAWFVLTVEVLPSISILSQNFQGVVAQWCNPLTLQPERSGGVGLMPGRVVPLERHDKGSRVGSLVSWTRFGW